MWLVLLHTYQVFAAPSRLRSDCSSEVDEQSKRKFDSVNRSVDGSTEQVLDMEAPFIKTNRVTEAFADAPNWECHLFPNVTEVTLSIPSPLVNTRAGLSWW